MKRLFDSFFAWLPLVLGLGVTTAVARDVEVEVAVLHTGGMLSPAELEAALADSRLAIEAYYQPTRLIEGETARRERRMPIGSTLVPIQQELNFSGAGIERKGHTLRVRIPEVPPGHPGYRLSQVILMIPVARGMGRPEPGARISFYDDAPPADGHWETAKFGRYGAVDLGLRVRHRWSNAKGAMQVAKLNCHSDIEQLGNGEYRFRPRHRYEGLHSFLASDVQSDPPSRPRAGQRSLRMREPFPEPIAGWRISRNHLIRLDLDGRVVERLSVYAQQGGSTGCRRSRAYEALFAGGQPVVLQRSVTENDCKPDGASVYESAEAAWAEDGKLVRYIGGSQKGTEGWDSFIAATCSARAEPPPPEEEVSALQAELRRIRDAFLRP